MVPGGPPMRRRKSSHNRCTVAPTPEVAKFQPPGFSRSQATNSAMSRAGTLGLATSTKGPLPAMVTGSKVVRMSISRAKARFITGRMTKLGPP